jgi:ribonuclease BN (tRNA processing enzyme)
VFGGLRISWCPLHHPGGCTAYRVDEPSTGASAVVATDVEWGPAGPAERRAFLDLCARPAPPRLLLFDGQFSRAESARFAGWGHSAWEDAVDAARETGAERLLVIHHGPRRDDGALAAMECEARAALPETRFARGGMEVEL